jgi:predicted phage terminase large subunit-like protein
MTAIATTRPDVALLSPAEQREYVRLKGELFGGEDLRTFMRNVSPHLPPPRHLNPIIEQLERARMYPGTVNVLISLPPRHAKTTTVQHAVAWWLKRRPADTCAYVSYNNAIAYSKSRGMRDLSLKAGVKLRPDTMNLAEWRTVHGGGLLATGAGGGLTGQGVTGLMFFDDPYKKMKDALSDKVREAVMSTYDSVVQTRLECASTFIIHTRWTEDDLIGVLAKEAGWVVINIPALAEENDILGRAVGEPLWPERFGLGYMLKRKKRNLAVFQALYQGMPLATGSKVFGPAHYYDQLTFKKDGKFIVIGADPAAEESAAADFSTAVALYVEGLDPETMKVYLVDVYHEQVQIPTFVDELIVFQGKHGHAPAAVEAVAGFKAVPQMMRRIRPHIDVTEAPLLGNKYVRAQHLAALWNEGRFLLPLEASWDLEVVKNEFKKFTGFGDKRDDVVDACSHAVNSIGGISLLQTY